MIDVAEITEAVRQKLLTFPAVRALISDSERITRGEYVNRDAAVTPWLGVYRQPVKFSAKNLGNGPGSWEVKSRITILAQAHADGGKEAEDVLCDLVDAVLDALIQDLSFGGTVGTVREISIEWSFEETESETMDFQHALIHVDFELRAP